MNWRVTLIIMQKNMRWQMLPIKKHFRAMRLSAEGWVAWGDVNYLNDEPQRAAEIWEQALEQKDPSENLYSRLSQIYQEKGNMPKLRILCRDMCPFIRMMPPRITDWDFC